MEHSRRILRRPAASRCKCSSAAYSKAERPRYVDSVLGNDSVIGRHERLTIGNLTVIQASWQPGEMRQDGLTKRKTSDLQSLYPSGTNTSNSIRAAGSASVSGCGVGLAPTPIALTLRLDHHQNPTRCTRCWPRR